MGSYATSSLPSQLVPPPPKSRFLSLPPEIRNSIYELLIIKKDPIRVCSPRRKHVVNREFTSKTFTALLRLNKQVNTEASTIFYSKNQFTFGNGTWGSTKAPNAHGLKAFLDRVPKKYLAHITNVIVEIHCRLNFDSTTTGGFGWVQNHFNEVHELGTMNDATNLHTISRALGTRFKGLEHVTYYKTLEGPVLYTSDNPDTKNLSKREVTQQLEKSLLLLVKKGIGNLKEIRTFCDEWVDMKTAVENVLFKKSDVAKVMKVPEPQHRSELV